MSKDHIDTSTPHMPEAAVTSASGMPAVLAHLASGVAVSGPELARRLEVSRAAVWKQVRALRNAGLDIQSGSDGYRLVRPLDPLDVERIRSALPGAITRRLGVLENHWRLDSTSSELARRAETLPDRCFVFADWQQTGRGRRGRQWLSPPATNLQFSCLKRFSAGYAALSGLSLVAGIAAVRALEDCGVHAVGLKWPNDLVHDDAKLGGILIELGGEFMGPCHAIIGVGINLRLPAAVRAGLDRSCVDLTELCGEPPSRNRLAAAMIVRLLGALEAFEDGGWAVFADAWAERDSLAGRGIRVHDAHGGFEGVAAGIDARGALRVDTPSGIRSVDSAEVSVRPA